MQNKVKPPDDGIHGSVRGTWELSLILKDNRHPVERRAKGIYPAEKMA